MANEQNLKPGEYKLTLEEQKKGGIASGEARRKKKTMRETLRLMLEDIPIDDENKDKLTNRELATLGLIKGARCGNATNYRTMLETLGGILGDSTGNTPTVKIELVDNSKLEKTLYEENKSE